MSRRPIVIAAGGTGGHVFPAQALAHELRRRGHPVDFMTDRRGARFELPDDTVRVHAIRSASPSRGGPLSKAAALVQLALGTLQARSILRRIDAACVVGFGGYPSVPPLAAASTLAIPTVLHEQNALLGRANRMMASRASAIATSFEPTGLMSDSQRRFVTLVGNPVRDGILASAGTPYEAPEDDGPFRVLVTGGSQGASVFADVLPAAVARLPEPLRARLRITQQARAEDIDEVRHAYAAAGVAAEVLPFVADMPERLKAAHLMICRSGASTVAELTVVGRPAILVPYPHAADDHQTANARSLERSRGAWVLPEDDGFEPGPLAERLATLMATPSALSEAAVASLARGLPDAASRLADLVLSTAGLAAAGIVPNTPADAATASPTDRLRRIAA